MLCDLTHRYRPVQGETPFFHILSFTCAGIRLNAVAQRTRIRPPANPPLGTVSFQPPSPGSPLKGHIFDGRDWERVVLWGNDIIRGIVHETPEKKAAESPMAFGEQILPGIIDYLKYNFGGAFIPCFLEGLPVGYGLAFNNQAQIRQIDRHPVTNRPMIAVNIVGGVFLDGTVLEGGERIADPPNGCARVRIPPLAEPVAEVFAGRWYRLSNPLDRFHTPGAVQAALSRDEMAETLLKALRLQAGTLAIPVAQKDRSMVYKLGPVYLTASFSELR